MHWMTVIEDNEFPERGKIEMSLKIRLITMDSCSCEPGHMYFSNVIPNKSRIFIICQIN